MSTATQTGTAGTRLASLDALRGFDMFWIMGGATVLRAAIKPLENPTLSNVAQQFDHVEWAGFHFIDLIFPLFLFMIGVSIPYSLGKRLARGDSMFRIYAHIVARVVILIVLGMMINGNLLTYDVHQFQITYSVLQMLALGYLVATVLCLHLTAAGQVLATLGMLVGYWALLAFVPVPGHQLGQFQPHCNVGDWLNDWILGEWQGRWRFGWILGILGHASTAMLGVFAGQILRSIHTNQAKVLALTALGAACLLAGLFWSGWVAEQLPGVVLFEKEWNQWPVWFPIVKNRWTSTFALYAGGWSYLLLALFYQVIDVWGFRRWAVPFMVIGANSIFAYMAWSLCNSAFFRVSQVFLGGLRHHVGLWHDAILWAGAVAVLWILLWYLYRNKTFIRV